MSHSQSVRKPKFQSHGVVIMILKKQIKKVLCFVLTVILIFCIIPFNTLANSDNWHIASIEFHDVEVIEFTEGIYQNGFYNYISFPIDYKITLSNGTVINDKDERNVQIGGEWYYISLNDNQYENHWEAGNTYTVTATLMGVSDTFNVTVIESPMEGIEIQDMSVIEGTNGYYNGDYYEYNIYPKNCTVTLKDGSVLTCNDGAGVYIGDKWYSVQTTANQYENHWEAGNTYTVTATLIGVSNTFNVTVTESPVEKIEIQNTTIFKGINDDSVTGYYYVEPNYTVFFKDGTTVTTNKGVYIGGSYEHLTLSRLNNLEVGKTYQETGIFCMFEDTFNVTLKDNPVIKTEFLKLPKTNYIIGEESDIYGSKIRVHFDDGSYEDIDVNIHSNPIDGAYIYLKKYNVYLPIESWFTNDNTKMIVSFCGQTIETYVTVKDNLMKSIDLSTNYYKQPVITVHNSDGTSYKINVSDTIRAGSGETENGYEEGGLLVSDKGLFDYVYYTDYDGKVWFGIRNPNTDSYCLSNKLDKLEWMEVKEVLVRDTGIISTPNLFKENEHFVGVVTWANIDTIINIAIIRENLSKIFFSCEEIKKIVYNEFGIDIDLNLSNNYNAENDVYRLPGFGNSCRSAINEIKYENGLWRTSQVCELDDVYTKFNLFINYESDLKIAEYHISNLPGDINGDSDVNIIDLVIIKKILTLGDKNKYADLNNDNVVNSFDIVLLKKYLLGVIKNFNNNCPKVLISHEEVKNGKTVKIDVILENNTGINSMKLTVDFDTSAFNLIGIVDKGNLGMPFHQDELTSTYILCWANDLYDKDYTYNGVIASLIFEVNDSTQIGLYPISVAYDFGNYDIYNSSGQQVRFETINGSISVSSLQLYGDVNSDGEVNISDRIMLAGYIKNPNEVQINILNADLNCDNVIDENDYYILTNHLMNKENYRQLPVKI